MIKINENFTNLQGGYLFAEIAKRVSEFQKNNPGLKVISLGIGDVTEPLPPSIIKGLKDAVDEMAKPDTFKGYRSDEGYEFLRDIIQDSDFKRRGVNITSEEIFITTGSKEDTANIQEIFADDAKIAITDPVYPVYIDSNVMAGRSGRYINGSYENIVYLPCNWKNDFKPDLPSGKVDIIYLCYPNNPTGAVLTKNELKKWVDYAQNNKALILYDAAYEAFIREEGIPHSIFEIEGAVNVAIEFRSLSKTAGFTGTRCGYTIIPKKLIGYDRDGNTYSIRDLWYRRQSTKFNGVAYIIQKAAYQVFTEQGKRETKAIVDYYLNNAKIIREGISSLGLKCEGGINAPYIWIKTPEDMASWEFFDLLLNQFQVVVTPGAGFGKNGEGYVRMTAFGKREHIEEAIERIKKIKF